MSGTGLIIQLPPFGHAKSNILNPMDLAEKLLEGQGDWDRMRLYQVIATGETTPVEITSGTALAKIEGIRVALNEGGNTIVLRRGSFGDAVINLQQLLKQKGYDIAIDNDFGSATELAVMMFQKENGLVVDGIVGQHA